MGRSGTSLLSKILSILGVSFGDRTYGPNEFNPMGYFEDPFYVDMNEQILYQIHGGNHAIPDWARKATGKPPTRWLWPPQIDKFDVTKNLASIFKERIKRTIDKSVKAYDFYGVKDPRVTLLLPLYLEIMDELDLDPYFIHIKRDPDAVARSLFKFHDFKVPHEQGVAICKRYNDDVQKFLPNYPKLVLQYEDILRTPETQTQRVADHLGLSTSGKLAEIVEIIRPDLNHNGKK
jgi:hypothetical protein